MMSHIAMNFAPLRKRFFGILIDMLILLIICVPIGVSLGLIDFDVDMRASYSYENGIILATISSVAFLIINGYFLAKRGQTIGKMWAGTKIVDSSGNKLKFVQVTLVRTIAFNFIGQIPLIGIIVATIDLLFVFSEEHRTLHDRLAGSYVVRA
jgi:uncharacterized RDD family membrane protein YckC